MNMICRKQRAECLYRKFNNTVGLKEQSRCIYGNGNINISVGLCKNFSSSSQNYFKSDRTTTIPGIPNAYNAVEFEHKIAERWNTRQNRNGGEFPTFRMILPPPNVTGKLHLGHALTVAVQDSIVRLKWMAGSNIEWVPGFDHAGIATHSVVLRKLQQNKKKSKHLPMPEAAVLQKGLEDFAEKNRNVITEQIKHLGALLNWDRAYYTLDEEYSDAVHEAFIHLFENGTICRGDGVVNWSCQLQSTISDVEVERADFTGKTSFRVPGYDKPIDFGLLFHCCYNLENSDDVILVATSRPETMFGDVAVAIHPDHPLYSRFIGSNVINPISKKIIPVIADSRVKIDFGTGALKITPAHDKLDFAIGKSHNLPTVSVFTKDGKMSNLCGRFQGLERFNARRDVVDFLTKNSLLKNIEEYNGSLGLCSRSDDIIEAMVIPHWFFKTEALTKIIMKAVETKQIIIKPDYQKLVLFNTLSKSHDWCLSRQIAWGHPIPAYYHKDSPEVWVAAQNIQSAREKLKEKLKMTNIEIENVRQDQDVLDTWFSSALIPLIVSDWPNTEDFQPLSLMETGQDILIFWVWRMMLMNLALVNKLPFTSILLHGIVCDYFGRKMSKSRGNVVDPMHIVHGKSFQELLADAKKSFENSELTDNEYKLKVTGIKKDYPRGFLQCGADALRFALLAQDISVESVKLDITYLENCKHFCNKLWQAMRFYLLHKEEIINHPDEIANPTECFNRLPFCDKWILSCLHNFVQEYEEAVLLCKFHSATEAIRKFFYLCYCDVYLELVKKDFQDETSTELHMMVMLYAFCTGLKLSHPFLPFVTEEIWLHMTEGKKGLLLDQSLPSVEEVAKFQDQKVQDLMKSVLRVVREVRHLKSKFFRGVKEKQQFFVEVDSESLDLRNVSKEIELLSKAEVKVEAFGEAHRMGLVSTVFELDGGGSCRVSFLKKPLKDSGYGSNF